LFSGTPGNLTALQCSNNIMVLPASLTNGTQYYLRVYSKVNGQAASFRIGLFDEATLSANECLSNTSLLGPNLIANPRCESDETYLLPTITMGTGYAGKKLTKGWWGASEATPDTWNADYPRVGFGNVPNDAGYGFNKIPRSGKGMLGMINDSFGGIWVEYVTGKLKLPLVKGKTYFVSFYVNFADNFQKAAYNVGALFSNDSIRFRLATGPMEITPQVVANAANAKEGANGWRNICGYVYADKDYSFITIGNFGNHTLYGGASVTYFFIDDVMVAETDSITTYTPLIKPELSLKGNKLFIYPNPVSSDLHVIATVEKDEMVLFRLISSDGRTVVTKHTMLRKGENIFNWDIDTLAAGSYFLVSSNTTLRPVHIVKQ